MRILVTFLILFATFPAVASDYDEYLEGLESGPDPQRVLARQMLPREGMRAFPDVLELMQHDNQLVWRTARNILSDIAHATTAKGYESEREDATAQLLDVLDDAPQHAKIEILRLLGRIAPEGTDLSKLEPLLDKKIYRSEVIDALVVMGTPEADAMIDKYHLLVIPEDADAELAHLETLILSGGNWDRGIKSYRVLLESDRTYNVQSAAIAALGRFGDETVLPDILNAAKKSPELEAPALMGLESMHGRAVNEALLEAYPNASEQMQLGLLGVMGRKQNPLFLPLLLESASSDDPARKALAFEALVQSELPDGADAITAYVESRPEDDRKFEVENLLTYADAMKHRGAKAAAGKAYLTLYQTTDNPEFREIAFQGIKDFPTPQAYEVILSDLDLDNLDDVSAETLIALNVMIEPDAFPEASEKLGAALLRVAKSTANVQAILDMAHQQGVAHEFVPMLGFIQEWHLAGPFLWKPADGFTQNHVDAPEIDLDATYLVDGEVVTWKHHQTGHIVNAIGLIGARDSVCLYGYAAFQAKAGDAQIRVGSDDGVRIWLNGETVHENNVDRGMTLDQDVVPVTLKDGENKVIVQVTQGAGGWGFMMRMTHSDGTPILIAN